MKTGQTQQKHLTSVYWLKATVSINDKIQNFSSTFSFLFAWGLKQLRLWNFFIPSPTEASQVVLVVNRKWKSLNRVWLFAKPWTWWTARMEKELSRITFLEFHCMPLKEFITIIYLNPIPSGETGHPACEAFRND